MLGSCVTLVGFEQFRDSQMIEKVELQARVIPMYRSPANGY